MADGTQYGPRGPELFMWPRNNKNHNISKFLKLSFFWDTLYGQQCLSNNFLKNVKRIMQMFIAFGHKHLKIHWEFKLTEFHALRWAGYRVTSQYIFLRRGCLIQCTRPESLLTIYFRMLIPTPILTCILLGESSRLLWSHNIIIIIMV